MAVSDRARVLRASLGEGVVIPAHPLALTAERRLDERRQRALTRYYLDAGAGGIAVGVHTTQFAIRKPEHGLYRPVLELAAETARDWRDPSRAPIALVAGAIGDTAQAVAEAEVAASLGYDVGLLSLGALRDASDAALVAHCRAVAEVIPLFGFYLQPAVGGRVLGYRFWRAFAEIRARVGDQDRAVRPLPDARRRARRGRLRPRRPRALHRQRRHHRRRPGDPVPGRRRLAHRVASSADCWASGRCGRTRPCSCSIARAQHATTGAVRRRAPARRRRAHRRERRDLRRAPTASPAASPASTKCCAARDCCAAPGAWIRTRSCQRGQAEEIERVIGEYPELTDDGFVAERLEKWLRD